mgnify:CR=1 FL=1
MEILSERSSRVVSYAKLHRASVRRSEGRFLVEGANAVAAALESGRALQVLVRESDADRHADVLGDASGAGVDVVGLSDRAAEKLSEATTPPGIFALAELLDASLADVLSSGPRLLAVAVEPREPGNAGTLIRTADAMGADAVMLSGETSVGAWPVETVRTMARIIESADRHAANDIRTLEWQATQLCGTPISKTLHGCLKE